MSQIRTGGTPGKTDTVQAIASPEHAGQPSRHVDPKGEPILLAPGEIIINAKDAKANIEPLVDKLANGEELSVNEIKNCVVPVLKRLVKPKGYAKGGGVEEPEVGVESPNPTGESPNPTGESPNPTGESPNPTGESPNPTGESPNPSAAPEPELGGVKAKATPSAFETPSQVIKRTSRSALEPIAEGAGKIAGVLGSGVKTAVKAVPVIGTVAGGVLGAKEAFDKAEEEGTFPPSWYQEKAKRAFESGNQADTEKEVALANESASMPKLERLAKVTGVTSPAVGGAIGTALGARGGALGALAGGGLGYGVGKLIEKGLIDAKAPVKEATHEEQAAETIKEGLGTPGEKFPGAGLETMAEKDSEPKAEITPSKTQATPTEPAVSESGNMYNADGSIVPESVILNPKAVEKGMAEGKYKMKETPEDVAKANAARGEFWRVRDNIDKVNAEFAAKHAHDEDWRSPENVARSNLQTSIEGALYRLRHPQGGSREEYQRNQNNLAMLLKAKEGMDVVAERKYGTQAAADTRLAEAKIAAGARGAENTKWAIEQQERQRHNLAEEKNKESEIGRKAANVYVRTPEGQIFNRTTGKFRKTQAEAERELEAKLHEEGVGKEDEPHFYGKDEFAKKRAEAYSRIAQQLNNQYEVQ